MFPPDDISSRYGAEGGRALYDSPSAYSRQPVTEEAEIVPHRQAGRSTDAQIKQIPSRSSLKTAKKSRRVIPFPKVR